QHQDLAGHLVDDCEVGVTVAVEVAHRDRGGETAGGGVGRGGEAAAGAAEQHRDDAVEGVGDGEVGGTVAVEVAHRDREGESAGGDVGRSAEAATSAPEQHRDTSGALVRDREVGVTVAFEVPHRDRVGPVTDGEVGRTREGHGRQRPCRRRRKQGEQRWSDEGSETDGSHVASIGSRYRCCSWSCPGYVTGRRAVRIGVRSGSTLSSHDTAVKPSRLEPWGVWPDRPLLPGSTLWCSLSLPLDPEPSESRACAAESNDYRHPWPNRPAAPALPDRL